MEEAGLQSTVGLELGLHLADQGVDLIATGLGDGEGLCLVHGGNIAGLDGVLELCFLELLLAHGGLHRSWRHGVVGHDGQCVGVCICCVTRTGCAE